MDKHFVHRTYIYKEASASPSGIPDGVLFLIHVNIKDNFASKESCSWS